MSANRRVILFSQGKIFLTPTDSFGIEDTTFPLDAIGIKPNIHVFFEVECAFSDGILSMKVTDYFPADTSAFKEQAMRSPVTKINFRELKWEPFERLLWKHQKSELKSFLAETQSAPKPESRSRSLRVKDPVSADNPDFVSIRDTQAFGLPLNHVSLETSTITTKSERFEFPYSQAVIHDGYILISKKFQWSKDAFQFSIENLYLKKEFDFIKPYFEKAVSNKKKFIVSLKVSLAGEIVTEWSASSEDIAKIDPALIEGIKKTRTRKIASILKNEDSTKALFTADDIFSALEQKNVFNQTEEEIISLLAQADNIRNKRQLEYLSGQRHKPTEKIRFTLKPLFGFLFFIEGRESLHYCWELLNSHATYLWTFQRSTDIQQNYARLEEIINLIHEIGRENYKAGYKRGEFDSDFRFIALSHKTATTGMDIAFETWKNRLFDYTG